MTDSTTKEKTFPVWSDTLAGVEVSIYRNVIKGAKLPQYKISRKKWYEKQGEIKSNYTLSREDWSIAMALERDAWRDIARMARSERAALRTAKQEQKKQVEQESKEIPVEMYGE